MICSNCGAENSAGRRFCGECGRPLAVMCSNCGAANEPVRFCGQCGSPLPGSENVGAGAAAPSPGSDLRAGPTAERRLVSVLFADLVGFTPLAEARDPDEVREVLSHYFETCRTLIGRYGGTVEKFIGDAVMAMWGAPVAQEDDAERAVRAALDLTQAVAALGEEVGWPDLRARAGVLTGEAAVTIGATGEGMVAGDLVNTASRIQAAAHPGAVFVGDGTRRPTEAAIAYEDAGLHELKGKSEPLQLWHALRVVAMRGGLLRSEGLEAPFVGRDAELRTAKDLFHTSAESRKAHMVSVIGVAGIGKSRLSWEFYKYIDGLQETIRWHRGRCLAYGEGVTYWALAEMVRGRAGISEGEEPAAARSRLHSTVDEFVSDAEERSWVETRLGHLLALEDRTAREPEDLFGAWRLFFERMAEQNPVVLVFEDMQWADPSLLDFVDYLMNWSRGHPLFVMSLARPEVADRFPAWAAGRRGVSTMYLEPLSREDMEELLQGLVPGLPEGVRDTILDRAEGVPLYAVETVRMLLDRGLLVQEGSVYRPAGPIEHLDVPESLHALIAARLDGLPSEERAVLQDAAVIGKTFSAPALSVVSRRPEPAVQVILGSLVRKEVLSVQADPRSPERGQYVFLQDLVRRVAYETLSMRDRKARHLAVAEHLEAGAGGEENEIVEVLASHYLEASRAAPDAPDASEIKARARDALVRAAARSESLAARREALTYFEQAIELTDDRELRIDLFTRAGNMANDAGLIDRARELFDRGIALTKELGDEQGQARIEIRRAYMSTADGRLEQALERLQWAFQTLSRGGSTEDLAKVGAEMARIQYFLGRTDEALESIELSLPLAEQRFMPEVIAEALNTKSLILRSKGRPQESFGLLRQALRLALEHDATWASLRAYNNLASLLDIENRFEEAIELMDAGLALARKMGIAGWEAKFLADRVSGLTVLGRWDEAIETDQELSGEESAGNLAAMAMERTSLTIVYAARGELDRAEASLSVDVLEASQDVQAIATLAFGRSLLSVYAGRFEDAIDQAERVIATRSQLGMTGVTESGFQQAVDAALALGDRTRAEAFVEEMKAVPLGEASPSFRAEIARLEARIAAIRGEVGAARTGFDEALATFRKLGVPFRVAVVLTEQGEWLAGLGNVDEAQPLVDEALAIFEELKATWWLDRIHRVRSGPAAEEAERQIVEA